MTNCIGWPFVHAPLGADCTRMIGMLSARAPRAASANSAMTKKTLRILGRPLGDVDGCRIGCRALDLENWRAVRNRAAWAHWIWIAATISQRRRIRRMISWIALDQDRLSVAESQ